MVGDGNLLCKQDGGEALRVITKQYGTEQTHITLYPIADVHLGSAECLEREFAQYLKRIEADENAAVVLAGDLIEQRNKIKQKRTYTTRYIRRATKAHDG
jgi:DNA polymerase II small subunit/DNA polymerase delta subunit B